MSKHNNIKFDEWYECVVKYHMNRMWCKTLACGNMIYDVAWIKCNATCCVGRCSMGFGAVKPTHPA